MTLEPRTKYLETGFTLIEIMTAVSIFAVVMTISMGSILRVFDTNRKSEALKAVMDNLNLAVESMSREMRFGSLYSCEPAEPIPNPPSPADCIFGGSSIAFQANNGDLIVYALTEGTIEKSINGNPPLPVTAEEINISSLLFYVLGSSPNDDAQPRVHIKIKGTAGVKDVDQTDFTVQTMISQRKLDRNPNN